MYFYKKYYKKWHPMNFYIFFAYRYFDLFRTIKTINDSHRISKSILIGRTNEHLRVLNHITDARIKELELKIKNSNLPFIKIYRIHLIRQLLLNSVKNAILIRCILLKKIIDGNNTDIGESIEYFQFILQNKEFMITGEFDRLLSKLKDNNCECCSAEITGGIIIWNRDMKEKLAQVIIKAELIVKTRELFYLLDVFEIILEHIGIAISETNLADIIHTFIIFSNINANLHINEFRIEKMCNKVRFKIRNIFNNMNSSHKVYFRILIRILEKTKAHFTPLNHDFYRCHFHISFLEKKAHSNDPKAQEIVNNVLNNEKINSIYLFVESLGCEGSIYNKRSESVVHPHNYSVPENSKTLTATIATILYDSIENRESLVMLIQSLNPHITTDKTLNEDDFDKCKRILQLVQSVVVYLIYNATDLEIYYIYDLIAEIACIWFQYCTQSDATVFMKDIHNLFLITAITTKKPTITRMICIISSYIEQDIREYQCITRKTSLVIINNIIDVLNSKFADIIKPGDMERALHTIIFNITEVYDNIRDLRYEMSFSEKNELFSKIANSVNSILYCFYSEIGLGDDILETARNAWKLHKYINLQSINCYTSNDFIGKKEFLLKFICVLQSHKNEFVFVDDMILHSILLSSIDMLSRNDYSSIGVFIEDALRYIVNDLEKMSTEYQLEWLIMILYIKFESHSNISLLFCEEIQMNQLHVIEPLLILLKECYFQNFHNCPRSSHQEVAEILRKFAFKVDSLIHKIIMA